jgi:hypothetical protein
MAKRKYWSAEDTDYLIEAYTSGARTMDIASRLKHKSLSEIYARISYLQLNKRGRGSNQPNKIQWTADEIKYIQQNFHSHTNVQMAKALGKKLTVVRNKCRELGLLHMELEYWTHDQVEFLKANYSDIGDTEIAEIFNKIWPKKKGWTLKHIEKKRRYLKLKRTDAQKKAIHSRNKQNGRFSINHWKRWVMKAPVGEIRIWMKPNGGLSKFIKTARGWVHLAPEVYKQHFGPIKPKHVVRFKDGNPLNCDPSNLEMVTRAFNAKIVHAKHIAGHSDQYIAGILAKGDKNLKKMILQVPELIENKRMQLNLNRKINDNTKKAECNAR